MNGLIIRFRLILKFAVSLSLCFVLCMTSVNYVVHSFSSQSNVVIPILWLEKLTLASLICLYKIITTITLNIKHRSYNLKIIYK